MRQRLDAFRRSDLSDAVRPAVFTPNEKNPQRIRLGHIAGGWTSPPA
jgi:hypothetical protein